MNIFLFGVFGSVKANYVVAFVVTFKCFVSPSSHYLSPYDFITIQTLNLKKLM